MTATAQALDPHPAGPLSRATAPRSARRGFLAVFAIVASTLVISGCAAPWTPITDKTPRPFDYGFQEMLVPAPVGWMAETYAPLGGAIFYTVHGRELEEIWVRRFPRTQVVKGTNRSVSGELTVQDMAEISLDSRRLDKGTGAFEVLSNAPASVDARDCFRLDYRYRNEIGLEKRALEYGCPVGSWLYRMEFIAPEQYYFDRYVADFEAMVRGVQFKIEGR